VTKGAAKQSQMLFSCIRLVLYMIVFVQLMHVTSSQNNVHDFSAYDLSGNIIELSRYRENKMLLIVNSNGKCGRTYDNYRGLVDIYSRYGGNQLEILLFQEPETTEEIKIMIKLYGIKFPVFSSIDVKGLKAHPLFTYLRLNTDHFEPDWNFNKYLISDGGKSIKHYGADFNPSIIEKDIANFLNIDIPVNEL
jgi:glutathione peroxidase